MESFSARTPSKHQQQQQPATARPRGGSAAALSAKSHNTRTAAALNALKTPDKQRKQQVTQLQQPPAGNVAVVASGSTRKKRSMAVEHDEESAVIKNGRALMAATTTQLGAPAEISNNNHHKRRKMEEHHQQTTIDLTTPKKQQHTVTTASRRSAAAGGGSRRSTRRGTEPSRAENTESRRAAQERENKLWKAKYTKAFKGFTFYFDGIEEGTKRQIERALKQLESAVEPFFSKEVTHVLTTRPIPPHLLQPLKSTSQNPTQSIFAQSISTTSISAHNNTRRKSSSVSPVKHALSVSGKHQQQQESLVGPSRRSRTRNAVNAANSAVLAVKTPPKIKAFADVGALDSQDILHKAHSFGMKLWTLEKLHKMVARLLDCPSPPYTHGMSWNFNHHAPLSHNNISNAGSVFALQMATGSHHHTHNQALRAEALSLATTAANTLKASLPTLLRAEALTGSTYERDLNTLRPDYTYFSSKTGYLLVEDSSQEYQPAHTKVFESRLSTYNEMVAACEMDSRARETTVLANSIDWPVLHGGQEGRTAFSRPAPGYCPPLPNLDLIYQTSANANKENVAGGKKGKNPAIVGGGNLKANTLGVSAPSLRRSASMNALNQKNGSSLATLNNNNGVTTRLRSKQQASISLDSSFQAASGNSQIISSNLASATSTTTTRSGQVIGGSQSVVNGGKNLLANGIIVDKRLARLGSKAGKHIVTLGSANNNGSSASSSLASAKPSIPALANGIAGPATMMKRSLSLDAGLNRLKPIRPPREEVKKPGYCENCRVRYDDFKAHTKSKKHRRFALDPNNWTELDELIADHIQRPILPELLELYHNAETEVPSDIEASDDSDSEMEEEEEELDEEDSSDFKAVSEAQFNSYGFNPAYSFIHYDEFENWLGEKYGHLAPQDYPYFSPSDQDCIHQHFQEKSKPSAAKGCSENCFIAMKYAWDYVCNPENSLDRFVKREGEEEYTITWGVLDHDDDNEDDSEDGEQTDSEEEDAMQDDTDEDEDDQDDEDEI